jgi:alpha-glucosidase (family GH31 glycosyl hydrolase)
MRELLSATPTVATRPPDRGGGHADPPRQYTTQPTEEPTTVRIYSGRDGSFRWYDDDGESLNYLQGKFTWTRLTWKDRERRLTIQPDGAVGLLPVEKTLVVEVIPDGRRQSIRYTGRPIAIGF